LKGTSIFILAIPLAILALFGALEILVAYLQAYIITFITCITFKDMA
jgi:F0F1-type ATP synthase membrane subunit a